MTKHDVIEVLQGIERRLEHGCGNHGCCVKQPTGMGTNGACRCSPREVAKELRWTAEALEARRGGWKDE